MKTGVQDGLQVDHKMRPLLNQNQNSATVKKHHLLKSNVITQKLGDEKNR